MKSILVIDDDMDFCYMLRDYLINHDIHLNMRHDAQTGLAALRSEQCNMVLLDVMLPDLDGLKVLSRIRSFSSMSVLILSTLGTDAARISGLDEGADDYLPKPINPRELVSRIRAIWRRSENSMALANNAAAETIAAFSLNRNAHEAYYDGIRLPLTEVEFSLLSIFLDSPGVVLTREDLVDRVLQRAFHPLDRSLDVHICRLRRKLEMFHVLDYPIKTFRNSGYLFAP